MSQILQSSAGCPLYFFFNARELSKAPDTYRQVPCAFKSFGPSMRSVPCACGGVTFNRAGYRWEHQTKNLSCTCILKSHFTYPYLPRPLHRPRKLSKGLTKGEITVSECKEPETTNISKRRIQAQIQYRLPGTSSFDLQGTTELSHDLVCRIREKHDF